MSTWPFDEYVDIVTALRKIEPVKEVVRPVNVHSADIQNLAEWFNAVPRYTTLRINTMKTNAVQVTEIIRNQLVQQAKDYDCEESSIPRITQDTVLRDCLVVGPWDEGQDKELSCSGLYPEVIVDVKCGVAVLRGAHVFAAGVMGMTPDVNKGDLVSVYIDISRKCLKGYKEKYEDSEKEFIGYGTVKMTRSDLFEAKTPPSGVAIEMRETVSRVPSFEIPSNYAILQNFPSILCSHVLDPQKSDLILDMCAAPGNKTTHIATLTNGQGFIIALDKTEKKINKIKQKCESQELNNVYPFVCDALKAVSDDSNLEKDVRKGPPFAKNTFDRILLDAPCSALGQRPLYHMSVDFQHINSYPSLQKKLFKTAVDLLKPSGVLVYSTCTLLAAENEGIVSWALNKFPNLKLVSADPKIGSPGNFNCGLTSEDCNLLQKFGPFQSYTSVPHHSETVGFFIAKFMKNED